VIRVLVTAVCLFAAPAVLAGCVLDSGGGGSSASGSSSSSGLPPSYPPQKTGGASANYPLTQGGALNLLSSGRRVAGQLPDGTEVLVYRSTKNESIWSPSQQRMVCDKHYDVNKGGDVTSCHPVSDTVPRVQQVTTYVVTGPHLGYTTHPNAASAISVAAGFGAARWRNAP
jgi:hypothetical protein